MKKNSVLLYVLLVMTVAFWGTSFAAVKIGMGNLYPIQFLFLRTLFASILFIIILSFYPRNKRYIEKKDIPYISYLGFMGLGGYFIVQYTALRFTTTVNASLLVGLSPLMITLYARLFLKEKLGLNRTIGVCISFVGIVLTITRGDLANFDIMATFKGDIFMLLNAVMIAIFSLGAKKMLDKYDPFVVVAYMNISVIFMLLPFVVTSNFLAPVPMYKMLSVIELKTIVASFYLGATCTVFGYYIWYKAIKDIGASKTSVFNYINPLVATIVSFLFFNESINGITVLGGMLIIAGVAINNFDKANKVSSSVLKKAC